MNENKIALLDSDKLEEMITELSYIRVLIDENIKPTSDNLSSINKNLTQTLENFDSMVEIKASEALDRINIDSIQKEIVNQVVLKFHTEFENGRELSELSELSSDLSNLLKKFHKKYVDIEEILDTYEKRVTHTKVFHFMLSTSIITTTFIAGALFNPFLLYFFTKVL